MYKCDIFYVVLALKMVNLTTNNLLTQRKLQFSYHLYIVTALPIFSYTQSAMYQIFLCVITCTLQHAVYTFGIKDTSVEYKVKNPLIALYSKSCI